MARLYVLLSLWLGAVASTTGQTNLLITEFMASNSRTLADDDGEFSDWIEIHNPTTNRVDLNGWYLTDSAATRTKWRFPATNLPPNGYLVVFASGKDRRVPGAQLHTNFRLDAGGEYLGLVEPDGVTVAHQYAPVFPVQAGDVSYGVTVVPAETILVASGAAARVLVPTNEVPDNSWREATFDDGAWQAVTTGVGFEAESGSFAEAVLVADSVSDFSGVQGQNNWFYGYWNRSADFDGVFDATNEFVPFPNNAGPWSGSNYWTGTTWNWFGGDPPWTELTSVGGRPNGASNGAVHWAIRRFICPSNGAYRIYGTLSHLGTCGDGVTARILVDGVEAYSQDVLGVSQGYAVLVQAVAGARMDFVIDPGPLGNDGCDSFTFTSRIMTAPAAGVAVADSMEDWSFSGVQGYRNWQYGYYNRTADAQPPYHTTNFVAFPHGSGPFGTNNFWTGVAWDWPSGNPPWDYIDRLAMHPNGVNNAAEHWTIRRWVSTVSGSIAVDWHVSKSNTNGLGVTGRVLHNGVEKDSVVVAGPDGVGAARSVLIANVQVGDVLDFALDPTGTGGNTADSSDGSWLNAVIHGVPSLVPAISSNIEGAMGGVNSSAYLRVPFVVTNAAAVSFLKLRVQYDDGFAAFLNGVGVAGRNAPLAPDPLLWNSAATAAHPDTDALRFEEIDLTAVAGLVQPGSNVLAIHGLNLSAIDPDFLLLAELVASRSIFDLALPRYFSTPTPGGPNGAGLTNLGPLILEVAHVPNEPGDQENLYVHARIVPTFQAVDPASLRLYYRVMYGAESSTSMRDDGLHGDGLAGDGVYGGVIPASVSTNGQMVRYYVVASDVSTNLTRFPPYGDPLDSPQYFGTVVRDPATASPLPALHWFIQSLANANTDAGTRCSLYFNGEFYDNVYVNIHGQSSRGFPKKSYDFDFNRGYSFRYNPKEARVGDVNLMSTYPDKAHMRNILAYDTYRDAGVAYHWVKPIRVQMNATFWGDAHLMENGDADWLERLGLDANGALYKMYNDFNAAADAVIGVNGSYAEKKTRKFEGNADLLALLNGILLTGEPRRIFIYDNIDVAQMVNSLAARVITGDQDCCHKNYYFYRDTLGTGDWQAFPWDVDLSFGRRWISALTYYDDTMVIDTRMPVGDNNALFQALYTTTEIRQMYWRRLRTLMDRLMQAPDGFPLDYAYERRIDELVAVLTPDTALDLAKWGTWGNGSSSSSCCVQTLQQAADIIKFTYLPAKRRHLFITNSVTRGREIPLEQPTNATVFIAGMDFNPSSGNQAQEYVQLRNTNTFAIDISGWRLSGAVDFTFRGGTVLPAGGSLYVSPDVRAFRARTIGPRGGQALFVQGNYKGQLSARGEALNLVDDAGVVRQTTNYIGNPSLPQLYLRITEIMYHPAPPALGSTNTAEDFEYIELKNIGPAPLNLTGVHFANGVEFSFTGSAVTSLAPGEKVLVVKNAGAFATRYGIGARIAGQYAGSLDNNGENIRLDDAVGEKILDFDYNDAWYPVTDGLGFSLVIVNENAPWNTWGLKESWRPTFREGGTPGDDDGTPVAVGRVLITEVLSHTITPPPFDTVELFNPTTNIVDVSGWYLSDDFGQPKKYRIPAATVLPPGGYRVFDENQFNNPPPAPASFAFSSMGDEAYLFSANANGNLTGYFHGFAFDGADDGVSFGRHVTSTGEEHFVAQQTRTFGGANAGPLVGPVVISEIMYHPPDLAGGDDNQDDEFIELRNITATNVPLFDLAVPTNTWRLRRAVDFVFPTNQMLAAEAPLLVVSFEPTNTVLLQNFRNRFGVPATVPVFGPYDGKLDNSAEKIELVKLGTPSPTGVPTVVVDRVDYQDSAPWPALADGAGASLQRRELAAYGNDVTNWTAAAPNPGADHTGGNPPIILVQPANRGALATTTAEFSVEAAGGLPLRFQWLFNGGALPGRTNATLVLTAVGYRDAGAYSVVVMNDAGAVASSNAVLSVLVPPMLLAQPTNVLVRIPPDPQAAPVTNAAFYANAVSKSPPVRYQWSRDGVPIPGATNSLLVVSNVQRSDLAVFSCALSDAAGTLYTTNAGLYPLIAPKLTDTLYQYTVVAGTPLILGAKLSVGFPPPFNWEWRRGSFPIGTNISDQMVDFFTLTTPTNLVTNALYRVVLRNLANSSPGVASTIYITTVPDADGDGLPDGWETAFGLSTNSIADRDLDADGDTMSNWAEYVAGTDPTNALSYLKVDRLTLSGGARLEFMAVSNRSYTVEFTEDLASGEWVKLGDVPPPSTNRIETVLDPNPSRERVYRLAVPMKP